MRIFGLRFLVAAFLLALVSGCAEPVLFSEVFQLEKGGKIYTKYNIWYTDPDDISCLNIQQGNLIPVGTEIEPVGTSHWQDRIIFKDASGKQYTIKFAPEYRICSMRDFIEYTFTTQSPKEMFAGIPDKVLSRIRRGEVVPGMNEQQVLLAYGPPPAIRTPDLRNETWIYWVTESETVRLVFRGDTVRQILNLNN